VGDQLAVHDDARGHEHRLAPLVHVLVLVVDYLGVLPGTPAAEHYPSTTHFLVAGQRLVEEVEDVVVHGDGLLHEIQDLDQPTDVVGECGRRGHRSDSTRIHGRRMDVTALHNAEHFPGNPADPEGFFVELTLERV